MPTNFLWAAGTAGLLTPAFNIMTTELEGLAAGALVVSSVNGASGVFTNSTTAQGMLADIFLSLGNPGIGTTGGGYACLSFWFLTSPDGGTTFESTTAVPPRRPNFIIPVSSPGFEEEGQSVAPFRTFWPVVLPAAEFMVMAQNNTGQTIGASGSGGAPIAPYLKVAPYAMQY
jgi:hypothetical protein